MRDDFGASLAQKLNEGCAGKIFLGAASTTITDSDGDSYDGSRHLALLSYVESSHCKLGQTALPDHETPDLRALTMEPLTLVSK